MVKIKHLLCIHSYSVFKGFLGKEHIETCVKCGYRKRNEKEIEGLKKDINKIATK